MDSKYFSFIINVYLMILREIPEVIVSPLKKFEDNDLRLLISLIELGIFPRNPILPGDDFDLFKIGISSSLRVKGEHYLLISSG